MLTRMLLAFALVLAAGPVHAQNDAPGDGAPTGGDDAWSVEVVRGSEVWRDFARDGRAGFEVRIGRPGIRVHGPVARRQADLRVHSATREPSVAAIPTHGLAEAFEPSRIPVQRMHRVLGETRIRTHGLSDALRPGGIRVHGFGGPRI
jgi:hypothetical protein